MTEQLSHSDQEILQKSFSDNTKEELLRKYELYYHLEDYQNSQKVVQFWQEKYPHEPFFEQYKNRVFKYWSI